MKFCAALTSTGRCTAMAMNNSDWCRLCWRFWFNRHAWAAR